MGDASVKCTTRNTGHNEIWNNDSRSLGDLIGRGISRPQVKGQKTF